MKNLWRFSVTLFFVAALMLFGAVDGVGQPSRTIDSLQNIVKSAEKSNRADTSLVRTLNALARAYRFTNPDKASEYAQRAQVLAQDIADIIGESAALRNMGVFFMDKGFTEKAVEHLLRAIRLSEKIGDSSGVAKSLNALGLISQQNSQYTLAGTYLRKALPIAVAIKDKELVSYIRNNLGLVLWKTQNYDSALVEFQYALSIQFALGDSAFASRAYHNIGLVSLDKRDTALAEEYFLLSANLSSAIGDQPGLMKAYYYLALLHLAHHKTSDARALATKAYQVATALGYRSEERNLAILLSECYAAENDYRTAYTFSSHAALLSDTLYNTESAKRIASLQALYESQKKDQEILLLQSEKSQQMTFQYSLVGAIVSIGIILMLVINNNQKKNRANRKLTEQKMLLQAQSTAVTEANALLQQAYQNLTILNTIGREITSTLNFEQILNTLYEQINILMDATIFIVGTVNRKDNILEYDFHIEEGRRIPFDTLSMTEQHRPGVQCVLEQKEIIDNHHTLPALDGLAPKSLVYMPLISNQQVIGFLSIQTPNENAYNDIHIQLLRSIASVAASVLDNARAYRIIEKQQHLLQNQTREIQATNTELHEQLETLRRTQTQLAQAEKMASLGTLVAGVAHELNTPIGVAVTAASTLHVRTLDFAKHYSEGALKKSELEAYVQTAQTGADLTLRNLERAANLIQSFKQVSVDQTYDNIRRFGVKQYLYEIITSLQPKWKTTGHRVEIECDEALEMETYAGAIAQIITNFVTNSLLHGFDGLTEEGVMRIEAKQEGNNVVIKYSDNGCGIPPEVLPRIFDPFFTTKQANGGTGLGMHIVYNLATQKLGGSIRWESELGKGATFIVELPKSM